MSASQNPGVIAAALDLIHLVELLGHDFEPRTLKQICELAHSADYDWAQTKIYNMLVTLEAGTWARKDSFNNWHLSPHFAALACSFYEATISRVQRARRDLNEVETLIHERTAHVQQS